MCVALVVGRLCGSDKLVRSPHLISHMSEPADYYCNCKTVELFVCFVIYLVVPHRRAPRIILLLLLASGVDALSSVAANPGQGGRQMYKSHTHTQPHLLRYNHSVTAKPLLLLSVAVSLVAGPPNNTLNARAQLGW